MYNYEIPHEFETLYTDNALKRAELAALREEYEHTSRFVIPLVRATYLIQIGALRAELMQTQISVRKTRRRIALMRAGADDAKINRSILDEFREWDERIDVELKDIEIAKASFSALSMSENTEETRALYRALARKMDPEVNTERVDDAAAFWPNVKIAYANGDSFQMKALYLMAEDYPESYEMPNDIGAMRRNNADIRSKIKVAEERLRVLRQDPAFEWRRLLDSQERLTEEQNRLRSEIAKAKIQHTALEDILRSIATSRIR